MSSPNLEGNRLEVGWERYVKLLDRQVLMETDSDTTVGPACSAASVPSSIPLDLSVIAGNSLTERRLHWSYYVKSVGDHMGISRASDVCLKALEVSRDDGKMTLATGAHVSTRRSNG